MFCDVVLLRWYKNVDALETDFGFTTVGHVGWMNAHITGFNGKGLVSAYMLLFTLQQYQNLLGFMGMDWENETRWVFNETDQHTVTQQQVCLRFFGYVDQGQICDAFITSIQSYIAR